MLERAVKPINNRHDTACTHNKCHFFKKNNVMTIFVILKSGTAYTRESPFLSSYHSFFFFFFWSSLVRNGLNAGWFLVSSHYKRLCASACTFETVQVIKVG